VKSDSSGGLPCSGHEGHLKPTKEVQMINLRRGRTLRVVLLMTAVAMLSTAAVALAHEPSHGPGHGHARGHGHGFLHHYGASGWVTPAANATTLSVRDGAGKVHSFAVNSTTKFAYADGSSATAANATPGRVVSVTATAPTSTGGNPVAKRVVIRLAEVAGEVTSNTGGLITLADSQGFTRTVDTTTAACKKGHTTVACSSIATGSVIRAIGKVAVNGTTLNATRVSSR
jgi:hypothetical protein